MKFRAVAASALALALAAGLTGCNLISPQRTTMEYAASDGVHATVGDLEVRNALLIVDSDTKEVTEANLVLSVVTESETPATLEASVAGGSTVSIPVALTPKNKGLVKVGFGDAGAQLVTGKFRSGDTVEVTFSAAGSEATIKVPVLGADNPENVLDEYKTLAPNQVKPTEVPSETPTPTAAEEPEQEAPVEDTGE
ncbi:hypothetical protein [uncultured Gulosibacter sp.]|uniref:hypothetical protein n=1 Tax=uncultured Gulosibacter sp. TaxID=1339167 RepID=UPI00288A8A56|nr:hypothetical protein [uncultured Gulosibacter sp.]